MYRLIQSGLLMALLFLGTAGAMANQPTSAVQQPPPVEKQTGASKEKELQGQVNINTATIEELVARLNGIGAKKAEAIVNYRENNGPFTSIEQLQEVPGIGPALMEKNSSLLTL